MCELSCRSEVLRESSVCVRKTLLVVVWIVAQSFLYIAPDLQDDKRMVKVGSQHFKHSPYKDISLRPVVCMLLVSLVPQAPPAGYQG